MTSARTQRRPVDVLGDVRVQTPAGPVSVTGLGRTVAVTVPRSQVNAGSVVRAFRLGRMEQSKHLTRLSDGLQTSGLELSFRIDRREIARVGGKTGWIARGLAMPGVKLRVPALVAALATPRRRPGESNE